MEKKIWLYCQCQIFAMKPEIIDKMAIRLSKRKNRYINENKGY